MDNALDDLENELLSFEAETVRHCHNLSELAMESRRVARVAHDSKKIVARIDDEFSKKTGLDKVDYSFLWVATALQVLRWVLIDAFSKFGNTADEDLSRVDHDDSAIKKKSSDELKDEFEDMLGGNRNPNFRKGRPCDRVHRCRTWSDILTETVPFDVTEGSAKFGLGLGANHREKTLGHDPILGWIFGVMNIMTDTTTLKDLRTFNMSRMPRLHFERETIVTDALSDAIWLAKRDDRCLKAAIIAESVHLSSDWATKLGLPVPILSAISPETSEWLYKAHYDAKCFSNDLGIVSKQASLAVLINSIIFFLHGLFYDATKYSDRRLYEVKTRKILSCSNLIASSSNVLYVAVRSSLGDVSAWKHLDFGGIAVTMYRLVKDVSFWRKVREEYVSEKFAEIIRGKPLNLWRR